MSKKIMIDTDIGDDIDDALALSFALRSEELELVGVTTVFKNTAARARMALALLKAFGKSDIPVGIGSPGPVDKAELEELPNQYLDEMNALSVSSCPPAVTLLRDKILASPGEITVIAIGALTNIAYLFEQYPETKDAIAELRIMGGAYRLHFKEWNILCDPEAARVVFGSGVPVSAIGLDVTMPCKIPIPHVDEASAAHYQRLLAKWMGKFKTHFGQNAMVLHDPLTIASLVDPSLLRFEKMSVEIETKGEHTRGMTFAERWLFPWMPEPSRNLVQAAVEVDAARFTELFCTRVFGAHPS